jgi:hypothetical protein
MTTGQVESPAPITVPGVVDTHTPPGVVFDYLSDPVNQVEWTPNFLELISGPDGPPGPGMRYRGRLKAFGVVDFVVDQYEPGRVFRVDTDPSVGRLTHRFEVSPEGTGSRVAHVVELWPAGAARLARPLMRLLIKRMIADLNKRMQAVLDGL